MCFLFFPVHRLSELVLGLPLPLIGLLCKEQNNTGEVLREIIVFLCGYRYLLGLYQFILYRVFNIGKLVEIFPILYNKYALMYFQINRKVNPKDLDNIMNIRKDVLCVFVHSIDQVGGS